MLIRDKILAKLKAAFNPEVLDIVNESFKHRVPEGAESHFKVVIVSGYFEGKSLLLRHRAIYHVLQEEMYQDIHALALHTYTTKEWNTRKKVLESPPCYGRERKNT